MQYYIYVIIIYGGMYVRNMVRRIKAGLVSLFFNGISTLFRLFNAKAILLEEQ